MQVFWKLCLLLSVTNPLARTASGKWSNSWAVEIEGGADKANEIAKRHGLTSLGQVGYLQNFYTFVKINETMKAELGSTSPYIIYTPEEAERDDNEVDLLNDPEVKFAIHQQTCGKLVTKNYILVVLLYENPIWKYQWNLNNSGQTGEENIHLDINVLPVWERGYTGSGVWVAVVDNGVQGNHSDIFLNYLDFAAYDYIDHDTDASPRSSEDNSGHGTGCAGLIAMDMNRNCGVGVAFWANVAGIRLIDELGEPVDSQIAASLTHYDSSIDIYSNSWGPVDTGDVVNGPGPLAQRALQLGAIHGRFGKGSIFTWAAGNGGYLDSCAADGYVQSIYTIPVGAYNQVGGPATYDEKCSAKMTVAYVQNTNDFLLQTPTITSNDGCALNSSVAQGSSSAAALVSGVISLALSANFWLTWRDIQYLIVYSSNPHPLLNNTEDYFTNGAGIIVSHQFGFGAIDAEAMVRKARGWHGVPTQLYNTVTLSMDSGLATFLKPFVTSLVYSGEIQYLEHLVVTMTLNVSTDSTEDNVTNLTHQLAKRGDFQVTITSPSNTTSVLLFPRPKDLDQTEGYNQWPFLSVLHWGEDPCGQWTIHVLWTNPNTGSGVVDNVFVTFYGVSFNPLGLSSCDTCESSNPNTLCRCDDQCILYNDCCPDASPPVVIDPATRNETLESALEYMKCQTRFHDDRIYSFGDAYYMVSLCPPGFNWTENEMLSDFISDGCENMVNLPPVSDSITGITYKNKLCAICHSVNTSELIIWTTELNCTTELNDEFNENITMDLIELFCPVECLFNPPFDNKIVMDTLRWCLPVKSTCLSFQWVANYFFDEDEYKEIVQSCANGGYNPINKIGAETMELTGLYKNSACALCNGVSQQLLSCFYPSSDLPSYADSALRCTESDDYIPPHSIEPAISIAIDIELTATFFMTEVTIDLIICDDNQLYDSILKECRDIVCPEGQQVIMGSCVSLPTLNDTAINVTHINSNDSYIEEEFNCSSPIALGDEDEFQFNDSDNSSVVFREEIFDVIGYDNGGQPIICSNFNRSGVRFINSSGKHSLDGIAELSYIGSALSIIASILILVTYSIFRSLRTLPSKLIMNLAVALLIGDIIDMLAVISSPVHNVCTGFAILLHFFFLARFSWMVCLGFEYTRVFLNAVKLRVQDKQSSQNKDLVKYMMFGWCVPFIITMITVIVNFTVEGSVEYGASKDARACWINNRIGQIVAFIVPISLALLFNIVAFITVVSLICIASRTNMKADISKKGRIPKTQIRVALGVMVVLGLTWILGLMANYSHLKWLWYPFVIINSNQAVLIAICFLATKKIALMYWSGFRRAMKWGRKSGNKSGVTASEATQLETIQNDHSMVRRLDSNKSNSFTI